MQRSTKRPAKRSPKSKQPSLTARWKPGHSSKGIAAAVAVVELRRISADHGGYLHPAAIIEAAHAHDSPLHPAFEWDDCKAAEGFRRDQARSLVQNLVVVRSTPAGEIAGPLFISIPAMGEQRRGYIGVDVLIQQPDMRSAALEEARRGFDAWQARYSWLDELEQLFALAARTFESGSRKKTRRKSA